MTIQHIRERKSYKSGSSTVSTNSSVSIASGLVPREEEENVILKAAREIMTREIASINKILQFRKRKAQQEANNNSIQRFDKRSKEHSSNRSSNRHSKKPSRSFGLFSLSKSSTEDENDDEDEEEGEGEEEDGNSNSRNNLSQHDKRYSSKKAKTSSSRTPLDLFSVSKSSIEEENDEEEDEEEQSKQFRNNSQGPRTKAKPQERQQASTRSVSQARTTQVLFYNI